MKFAILLAGGIVMLQSWSAPAQAPSWKTILSDDKTFSISFPTNPRKLIQKIVTSSGTVQVVSYVRKSKQQQVAYFFSYSELLNGKDKLTPNEVLERAAKSALKNFGGKLKTKKDLTLTGHLGCELVIDNGESGSIRNRIFVVKDRLYQLVITGNEQALQSGNAKRFFDSFKISK